jgi:hypothetical protein
MSAAVAHVSRHGSSAGRRPLHGRVQVDGVRVARGSITFLPALGNLGPAACTSIRDGKYRFTKQTGPNDGPHRVLIDMHSTPGQDDAFALEQLNPDTNHTGVAVLLERNAGIGSSMEEDQPNAEIERRWELEYTVPERSPDRQDFDL